MRRYTLPLATFLGLGNGLHAQECPSVTDIDGNTYPVVAIGGQCWMAENLRTTRYSNGDTIANVTDGAIWGDSTAAWCNYDNSAGNDPVYGKLYNWFAMTDDAVHGLCPVRWHVPSDADWMILEAALGVPASELSYEGFRGGAGNVGGKLKSTSLWNSPNSGATNESGFSGFPGGYRYSIDGEFMGIGNDGGWWSAPEYGADYAWCRYLSNGNTGIGRDNYGFLKRFGLSVRCVQEGATGMATWRSARLTIVPNPAHGSTTLNFAFTDRPAQIVLLDASGRTMDVQFISAVGSVTLDISAHENGLYFVEVLFADGTRTMERVVKE